MRLVNGTSWRLKMATWLKVDIAEWSLSYTM